MKLSEAAFRKHFYNDSMKPYFIYLLTFVLLTGCVPQLEDTGPSVALINAPAEGRISGLADKLESRLTQQGPLAYDFTSSSRVRFGETHRDMSGSRAALQAAFIARTYGAEWAVMIGAPTYEREVLEFSFLKSSKAKNNFAGSARGQNCRPSYC